MPKTTDLSLDGPRPVNVKKFLEEYDRMSITHFQRGLVWDTSSVALLLESLYYGTPCGSIILWTPSDVKGQGAQLGPGDPRYLIIDGQQRIRSLHAVFADNDDESATTASTPGDEDDEEDADASDEGADDKEDGVWCLNLGRLPEFAVNITGGKRFRLFRRASDPRRQYLEQKNNNVTGAPLQDREALLPLKWFLESLDQEAAIREHTEQGPGRAIAKAAQAVLTNGPVMQRLRHMLTHPAFHVSILRTDDWADVVGVFIRINSAGKRVEAEEKASANVVAEYKDANSSLEKFFVGVHGDGSKPLKVSTEPPRNRIAHMLMDPTLLADYQGAISSDSKSARVS